MTRKHTAILSTDELEGQDSPVLAVLKHYGAPANREDFLSVHFIGEIPQLIDAEEEAAFPEQFRRVTLLETPPVSEKVQ